MYLIPQHQHNEQQSTLQEEYISIVHDADPTSSAEVNDSIKLLLCKWNTINVVIPPSEFLSKILHSRGYSDAPIHGMSLQRRVPSASQVQDYDNELVWAVRQSNLDKLIQLYQFGRSLSACNWFSESVVHMACRRSTYSVVEFILTHGGDPAIIDDYGRTPLHDACWRVEPAYDIVTMLIDTNPDLLRFKDARGSTPLNYVREEHWLQWCTYLFHQRDKYWPVLDGKK